MPPLFRIDVGKEVHYALDEEEKRVILARIAKDNGRAKPMITRFKGLGEMNPQQLRRNHHGPEHPSAGAARNRAA